MNNVDQSVQDSFDRDAIRDAVSKLAQTCEPDGQYDPAVDPRPGAAIIKLADLLGNVSAVNAAEGIQTALMMIMAERL